MEIEELKNKFIPLEHGHVTSQLDAIVKGLGMPPSYCRFDTYIKNQNGKANNILKILTVHFENLTHKVFETRSTHRPLDADWSIECYSKIIRCKPLSNENFCEKLSQVDEVLCKSIFDSQQEWSIGKIIQTPDDGYLYMINSKNQWPAWMLIASDSKLDKLEPNLTARGANNNDFNDFVGTLLGFHPGDRYEKFFPCSAILVNQTLIRIEENRIVTKDQEETVFISFYHNRFGIYTAENSNPSVRYLLTGKNNEPIGYGAIKLNNDLIRHGLNLELSQEFKGQKTEIYHAEIGLYLGDTLVDRSSAPYIRKISVGITVSNSV